MFNYLHFHIFNFLHIQPHTPADGHAGSPAQPTPLPGGGQPQAAARWNTEGPRLVGIGCSFSCRIVFLRGGLLVCLVVCLLGVLLRSHLESCKEGDEEKVCARTWVGPHRCAPGLDTEGKYYR